MVVMEKSFSQKVKEELKEKIPKARHCQIAEISGIFQCLGWVEETGDKKKIVKISIENLTVREKYFILVKKAFSYTLKSQGTILVLEDQDEVKVFCDALKLFYGKKLVYERIVQRDCCKKAFLRGLFMGSGSVSSPKAEYHLDMSFSDPEKAEEVMKFMAAFEIESKVAKRKKNYIVYLKEGDSIVSFLNVIGAHIAMMELENVRIYKEVRNSVNRQVNCETANLSKVMDAAVQQIENIQYIRDTMGFDALPDSLQTLARIRLENPDVSLKELGMMLDPPLSKSGVNHRMRKLREIVEEHRSAN